MTLGVIQKPKYLLVPQLIAVLSWVFLLSKTQSYYSAYILCAVVGFSTILINYNKNNYFLTKTEKAIIFGASACYSLAVVLSNYELFLPLTQNLLELLLSLFGGFVVAVNSLIFLCKKVSITTILPKNDKPSKPIFVFLSTFLVISIINLLYLFLVVYPGYLTPDSIAQINQCVHGYTSNHHPFWHTIIISFFLKIGMALFGNMNAAVAVYSIAQILFMASCFAFAICTLYQSGIPKRLLLISIAIYALMPYNIAYSVTMWKDIVFGGAAVLTITAIYRIIKNIGKTKVVNYVLLFLGSLAFCVWRTNGWLALLASLPFLFLCFRKKHTVTVIILCVALVLGWFMRSPVINMLNIQQPDFVESLSIPVQQVARVITSDRDLTSEEEELLSQIVDVEEVPNLYKEYISDPIKNEIRSKNQAYLIEHKGEYLKLWVQLGLKYPSDYIKAWVDQTKGYWNGGYSYWIFAAGVRKNDFGITRDVSQNVLSNLSTKYFDFFETSPLTEPLKSIGLHVWILGALCVIGVIQKKKETILLLPIIMVIVTLLIATPVFSEFRYAYSLFTTLPVLIPIILSSPIPITSQTNEAT